ncbi:hypothetical protein [Pseudoalteromonas viridis]|uniref:Uncharacterized protein n=1 Tax=Pseudoalteromonas viridis TaxID=339617 RepID=A0ABX7V2I7_9GAMM|nr:hypothetical protein [Pseudoalteromonas viridis]QTL34051.1 hypothetical protein J5X90_10730 [Pseudoalteromonas viridis]
MRKLVTEAAFTQGAIFNGLKVTDSLTSRGIVISARCDLERTKSRYVLCLPVFSLKQWIEYYGNDLIFSQKVKGLLSEIEKKSKGLNIDKNVLDTFPFESFKRMNGSNEELLKLVKCYKRKKCDFSISFMKKERDNLLDKVFDNRELSFFFLERIHDKGDLNPHIIDVSNPISIPTNVALDISRKINRRKYNECDLIKSYLDFDGDIIGIESTLLSPYVEFLLQKFSSYYSRIGVEDISSETKKDLKEFYNE